MRHCLTAPAHFGFSTFVFSPFIGQALDLPDLQPRLRRKCLHILCRICGRRALLPKSLQIPLSHNRSDIPLYRGGYADVWKGEHQGCDVAVKVLRIYSTSDFGKVTTVGSTILLKMCVGQLILTRVEVLQRGCDVECPPPSKCTAAGGSYDG